MKKDIKKEYSTAELTVVWKPNLCIHSGICVKTLPEVYNPNVKPWVKADRATTEELVSQIKKCPSGALGYILKNKLAEETTNSKVKVEVMKNGPLLVHGTIQITDADDNEVTKDKITAFCRCGQSTNKPYCDGMHRKVGFEG